MIKITRKYYLLCILFFSSVNNGYPFQDSLFSSITFYIEDTQRKNYRYLGDMLSNVPGVWVGDIGSTGQWASYRMRGCFENQVMLLLDGRPLRDPWSGICDLNLIPVEMIEKIEIYPSLNQFGLTPIGAVINLVTSEIASNRPYTKFVYRTGSNNFSDLDITFGQKLSPKWEILSGALLKKYGETFPDKKYKSQQIRSKITYQPISTLEFRYSILHNKSDLYLPYSIPMPGDSTILTSPHRKRFRYDHTFQTKWNLWGTKNLLRVAHTSLSYEISGKVINIERMFPVYTTAIHFHQELHTGKGPLSWGIQSRFRQLKDHEGVRLKDSISKGYVQGQFSFKREYKTILQVHGHFSSDGKLRLLLANQFCWSPLSTLNLWMSYNEGVRDPSLGERFGYPLYPAVPVSYNQLTTISLLNQLYSNPNLKPEISRTIEAGMQWHLGNKIYTSIRPYYRDTRDLIQGVVTQKGGQFINQTKALFRGMETQFHFGPWVNFKASLILNLLKATDAEGENLLERPNLWGNGSLSWRHSFFQDDLNVHLTLSSRFWTGFWNLVGQTQEQSYLQYYNPGFILDFKAFFTIIKNATFTFAVDNILGTEVAFVSCFQIPKQMIRIGFSWVLFD